MEIKENKESEAKFSEYNWYDDVQILNNLLNQIDGLIVLENLNQIRLHVADLGNEDVLSVASGKINLTMDFVYNQENIYLFDNASDHILFIFSDNGKLQKIKFVKDKINSITLDGENNLSILIFL